MEIEIDFPSTGETEVVNLKEERYDVYIGRGSPWGNPFPITKRENRAYVIARYRRYIRSRPELLARLGELRGKRLGCYCHPFPCHGDVLVELVNQAKPTAPPPSV